MIGGFRNLCVAFAALLATAGGHPGDCGQASSEPAPLLPIADVKNLPDETLATGHDVRIRGVVTWRDDRSFVIEDPTGGIWITESFARRDGILDPEEPPLSPTVTPGEEIEVVGVPTRATLFSTMLMPRTLQVLGRRPPPPCRPASHTELFNGASDHLRVEVRGIVQGFRPVEGGGWWMLFVDGQPGEFGVLVPQEAFPDDPAEVVDAEVLVRGVSGACYNYRGEFLSPRLHVNGRNDIVVERAAAVQPFSALPIRLSELASYRAAAGGGHRRRVEGVVTFVKPGECFYLQDGGVGVRVETRLTTTLRPGDRIEVSGFVTMERRVAGLKEAVVNPIEAAEPPAALATTVDTICERGAVADGLLVQVPGRLLDVHSTADGCQLALVDGQSQFEASLTSDDARALLALEPGSIVALTGIAKADLLYDYRVRPSIERVGLLLRSADDVVVTRPPSWWTPGRLLWTLAALAAVLLAALGWAVMLRRQVAVQAGSLVREMRKRRDAAVEFEATLRERNRLAANLHDTLLQTLGGIGYQLEACEARSVDGGSEAKRHIDVAHRMVDHAIGQLKDSVWALRSLPLENRTFPAALETLLKRIGDGCDVRIGVESHGRLDDLPDFMAGNLLLVIQEAVVNAIRHGRPSAVTISVRAESSDGRVDVVVADDGCGFVPGSQHGVNEGHYGLVGMRERVEGLGGSLSVESSPGRGTTVRVRVARNPLDADLS